MLKKSELVGKLTRLLILSLCLVVEKKVIEIFLSILLQRIIIMAVSADGKPMKEMLYNEYKFISEIIIVH